METLTNTFEGDRLVFYDTERSGNALGDFFETHREIDRRSLYDFLLFGSILPSRTPLSGVSHLYPGETRTGDVSTNEYAALSPQIREMTREEFAAALEKAVARSIHDFGRDAAVLLSGGIDSAIIASFLPPSSPCITWGGWGQHSSDVRYSRETAAAFGKTDHAFVYADIEKDFSLYQSMVTRLQIPLLFSNVVPHLRMAEEAKERGINSWLMGQNADTLFMAYPAPVWVKRLSRLNTFFPFNPLRYAGRKGYLFSTRRIFDLFAYFKSSGIFPGAWIRVPRAYFDEKNAALKVLHPRNLDQRIILTEEFITETRRNQLHQSVVPALLGIRVGCPYYSREAVEIALAVPPQLRAEDGYDKSVMKELARRRRVPAAVIEKGKKGLSYGHREFMEKRMHIPVWDAMERNDLLNELANVSRLRAARENDFLTFDHLRSLHYWLEWVARPNGLSFSQF